MNNLQEQEQPQDKEDIEQAAEKFSSQFGIIGNHERIPAFKAGVQWQQSKEAAQQGIAGKYFEWVKASDELPDKDLIGWYSMKGINPDGFQWWDGKNFINENIPMYLLPQTEWLKPVQQQGNISDAVEFAEWLTDNGIIGFFSRVSFRHYYERFKTES